VFIGSLGKKSFDVGGLSIDDFGPFSKIDHRIWKKTCFFASKFDFSQVFSVNYSKNREKQNLKNDFSEKRYKIPIRRPPTEISGDPEFIDWKKVFEVGGLLSTIWSLYFKSKNPKFLSSGKKRVFCVANFFELATKTTVLFFRGAPKFFVNKLGNLPGVHSKNEGHWG
jgi:hypothetical protein